MLRTLNVAGTDQSQDWSFGLGQPAGDQDGDQDGLVDSRDHCPDIGNPLQTDADGDPTGDACDVVGLEGDGSLYGQD